MGRFSHFTAMGSVVLARFLRIWWKRRRCAFSLQIIEQNPHATISPCLIIFRSLKVIRAWTKWVWNQQHRRIESIIIPIYVSVSLHNSTVSIVLTMMNCQVSIMNTTAREKHSFLVQKPNYRILHWPNYYYNLKLSHWTD